MDRDMTDEFESVEAAECLAVKSSLGWKTGTIYELPGRDCRCNWNDYAYTVSLDPLVCLARPEYTLCTAKS